jgi:hypothetical protein
MLVVLNPASESTGVMQWKQFVFTFSSKHEVKLVSNMVLINTNVVPVLIECC